MTQLLAVGQPDFLASEKPRLALRPPRLTIANLALDLVKHIHVYRRNHLSTLTAAAFLLLRVLQHVAYDRGWNGKAQQPNTPRRAPEGGRRASRATTVAFTTERGRGNGPHPVRES